MPQPFAVPLHCPVCHRPFSVQIKLPQALASGLAPSLKIAGCPYDGCTGHVDAMIHGHIIAVWEGHGPEPYHANGIH